MLMKSIFTLLMESKLIILVEIAFIPLLSMAVIWFLNLTGYMKYIKYVKSLSMMFIIGLVVREGIYLLGLIHVALQTFGIM